MDTVKIQIMCNGKVMDVDTGVTDEAWAKIRDKDKVEFVRRYLNNRMSVSIGDLGSRMPEFMVRNWKQK